jgi:two-component system chemotaxis response regulator CheB
MPSPRKFLIVDDNADSRFLLVKTLLRKFPHAVLQETQNCDSAVAIIEAGGLDAVVVHRAAEVDGMTLLRELRQANDSVPIVMVSGIDRTKQALEAGATTFLSYDAWLRIGTVVGELIGSPVQTSGPKEQDAAPAAGGLA